MMTVARQQKWPRLAAVEFLAAKERLRPTVPQSDDPCHFLYLHSLPPNREIEFERMIRHLSQRYSFVSHSDGVRGARAADGRPTMSISVDDGFSSCLAIARVLEHVGARACFFVPSAGVGLRGRDEVRRFFGSDEGIEDSTLSWDELEDLRSRGHEIGNHSRDHRNLADLTPEHLLDDLSSSRELLSSRLGLVSHFAWPFGRFHHASCRVVQYAAAAGHDSVASAERGLTPMVVAGVPVLRRDHVDPVWPTRHGLMFVGRSRSRPEPTQPDWCHPQGANA